MPVEELKDRADILRVIEALGIEMKKKGSYFFILCPNPDHDDRHATNCYFQEGWSRVYCSVCRKSYNAIDVIMMHSNCDFISAVKILRDIEGCPEEKSNKKKTVMFYQNELRFLGIKVHSINMPLIVSDQKLFLSKELPHKAIALYDDGYIIGEKKSVKWSDFYTNKQFCRLVKRKIAEKEKELQKLSSLMPGLTGTKEFKKQHETIAKLRKKVAVYERCHT